MPNITTQVDTSVKLQVVKQVEGKETGFLNVPCPTNRSAWGVIRLPFITIEHGQGPTVLLTAGVHGDEYEGPIALTHLAQSLEPEFIQGKLMILPAVNIQGVMASTRLAPADQKDLNRVYPGKKDGMPAERVGHYISQVLVPQADAVLDFHSGGYSLEFLPCSVIHDSEDPVVRHERLSAAQAFGAPYSLVLEELDDQGMLDSFVESQGKLFLSTELGGGGRVTVETVAIAKQGVSRLLTHLGVFQSSETTYVDPPSTQWYQLCGEKGYIMAPENGVFEAFYSLGDAVKAGDILGLFHVIDNPLRSPVSVVCPCDGIVFGRRAPALACAGDTLVLIGVPYEA